MPEDTPPPAAGAPLLPAARVDDVISRMAWPESGLLPVVTQDATTGQVLMVAYADREAVRATLRSGWATYYSRSRQRQWVKGATSGHLQQVRSLRLDCDRDAILLQVDQTGPACHTGTVSCFDDDLVIPLDPVSGQEA